MEILCFKLAKMRAILGWVTLCEARAWGVANDIIAQHRANVGKLSASWVLNQSAMLIQGSPLESMGAISRIHGSHFQNPWEPCLEFYLTYQVLNAPNIAFRDY